MNNKLKTALKHGFVTPSPQRKEQFINRISYPKTRLRDMVIAQIGYIRKRVWVLFILSIAIGFIFASYFKLPENIIGCVSGIIPLLSLCTISEVCKSKARNMEEIELSCKCNLPKIVLIRISILGAVSFTVLLIYLLIVGKSGFGTFRNLLYLSVPYLLSTNLSLFIVTKFHSKEMMYICSAVSGVVSVFMVIASNNYRLMYAEAFTFVWATIFIVLIGLLFYILNRFIKSQEELQWSLS